MQQYDIFPTNVFVTKAKKHSDIFNYFENNIIPEYEKQNSSNTTACNVFSDYFAGAPKLDQSTFGKFYQDDITEFLQTLEFNTNASWNLTSSYWYSITGKNGWQEKHCHIGGPNIINFSAVHYVKLSEEHTPLRFFNPMEQLIKATFPSDKDEDNPFMFRNLKIIPPVEEGDLIFFPSYLNHDVPVQTSDKTRISVAINIGITKQ